jgi:plasmid stability protein
MDPKCILRGKPKMPVNLSVKNVPDHIAAQIRRRAAKHHRSLQGELVAILEETVAEKKMFTPSEFLEELRAIGLKTPAEAAKIIRKERDARSNR